MALNTVQDLTLFNFENFLGMRDSSDPDISTQGTH